MRNDLFIDIQDRSDRLHPRVTIRCQRVEADPTGTDVHFFMDGTQIAYSAVIQDNEAAYRRAVENHGPEVARALIYITPNDDGMGKLHFSTDWALTSVRTV